MKSQTKYTHMDVDGGGSAVCAAAFECGLRGSCGSERAAVPRVPLAMKKAKKKRKKKKKKWPIS